MINRVFGEAFWQHPYSFTRIVVGGGSSTSGRGGVKSEGDKPNWL